MKIEKSLFGTTPNGKDVDKYSITNDNGMTLELITYGATIQSVLIPCADGKIRDVAVGFDSLDGHINHSDYEGNTVGRYANRLHNAQFSVGGQKYVVSANEKGKTCLHGGGEFSTAVWDASVDTDNSVVMSYTSPNGSMGFPGEMMSKVRFTLTNDNEVVISYTAICSADSPINFTNHIYFNFTGSTEKNVLAHTLRIDSDAFTPIDADSIPTGEIKPVKGTAFDFTQEKAIGRDIEMNDEQLTIGKGYDHNFCLNETAGAVITAKEESSGIEMNVYTDMPGVQLYTGNFFDGTIIGKQGLPLIKNAGFCLETQFYPDTPNQPQFPQCNFKAGEVFRSTTKYQFKF
ncbi:MAG: galactose mutarotase [Clostridia bacterium]|nr:galactose mutarotase [Clostridia bacterium]